MGQLAIKAQMPMTQQLVPVPPGGTPHDAQSVFVRHEVGHEPPPELLLEEWPAPDEFPLPDEAPLPEELPLPDEFPLPEDCPPLLLDELLVPPPDPDDEVPELDALPTPTVLPLSSG